MTGAVAGSPSQRPSAPELLTAAALIALACVFLSYWMGRDLNWDYFNYHGYAMLQLKQDRLAQDFFAAGYQGYMNPLAFLPWVWMQKAGWHSVWQAAAMAALHSLNVFFLYLICRRLVVNAPRPAVAASVLTALGGVVGVFIGQLGSTFYDVSTTPFVMAALYLLAAHRSVGAICLASALAGAAVALKWTNAPFALGILLASGMGQSGGGALRQLRLWLQAALAMGAGFLALYGVWGWKLWSQFGSPFFPLFNGIFKASDFPAQGFALDRFVPRSWSALVQMPWNMISLDAWVFTENASPDLRPLLLVVLLVFALPLVVWREGWTGLRPEVTGLRPLLWFYAGALPAWVITSSNGRYAVPLLLLLGPLIYLAACCLMDQRRALMLALIALILQSFHSWTAGNPHWNPHHWTEQWLPARVPEKLQQVPQLYVLVGRSSESYLAAYVHQDSAFTNPIGLLSIANNQPGWPRFSRLRDSWAGRTSIVFQVAADTTPEFLEQILKLQDDMIDRLGLTLSGAACDEVIFNVDASHTPAPGVFKQVGVGVNPTTRHLMICSVLPKTQPSSDLAAGRERAAEIMDALERRCPAIFQPSAVQVEGNQQAWTRSYGRHDLFVIVNHSDGSILLRQEHQATPMQIGQINTWRQDFENYDCRLPHDGVRGISTIKHAYR